MTFLKVKSYFDLFKSFPKLIVVIVASDLIEPEVSEDECEKRIKNKMFKDECNTERSEPSLDYKDYQYL